MFPGVQLLLPKKNHKITTQNVIDYFFFQVSIAVVAMVLISASASGLTTFAVRSAAFTARRINHGRLPPRFPHSFLQQPSNHYASLSSVPFSTFRTPFKNRNYGRCHAQQMRAASSSSALSSSTSISLELTTAEDTEEVGALLSGLLLEEYQSNGNQINGGFTIMLGGDLGAGKTAFSRGFIRAATGNNELRVTSPTYLLVNVYEATVEGESLAEEEKSQPLQEQSQRQIIEIYHMDLYRLSGKPEDLLPLNMDYVFANCISLIEWPERMEDKPEDRLDIAIVIQSGETKNDGIEDDGTDDEVRIMTLTAQGGPWERRLATIIDEGYLDDLIL